MKSTTHFFAAFFVASLLVPRAFGLGNGPGYDPTKTMLFPGAVKSDALYTALSNAGEYAITARAKKKGGKLKRVRDIEMAVPGLAGIGRLSSVGEGSLLKINATRLTNAMNLIPSSDGQSLQAFFRNKKGKVITGKVEVPTGGQFWSETFGKAKSLEAQLKALGKINPIYPSSTAQRPRGTSTASYVELDDQILAALQELTLAHLKEVVIALQAFNSAEGLFGFEDGDPTHDFFVGLASIAKGTIGKFLLTDPETLASLISQFISTSPDVIGLLGPTLADVIARIQAGGAIDFDTLLEAAQELVDIPVKALNEDYQFIVEYTWPTDQRDLDTGTTFLGETVGFAYADTAPYMIWTGDDTNSGGSESVTIDINGAAQAGVLPSSFSISCMAGWYTPAGGTGPIVLHLYLLNQRTGMRFGEVTREVTPGTQTGAATTPVGSASFTYSSDTNVLSFAID